jgi:hypothetical protein
MIRGLTLAERLAEGVATPVEYSDFLYASMHDKARGRYSHIAVWAVRVVEPNPRWASPEGAARSVTGYVTKVLGVGEPVAQCGLLRDIVGNPFRPVSYNPRWHTSTVLGLGQTIYADRAFDRLPILADALEEAGCDSADILAHCRGHGPHVRGCWVVDQILGKA